MDKEALLSTVQQIAVLHIDGDWYESVKTYLDLLNDRMAHGGIIQFDNYGYWQGARKLSFRCSGSTTRV